jgi:predicted O-methyltransferase YrrM
MKSLSHFIKYVLGLDAPDSQVTDRELQMLTKYCRNARVVCEIGCYEGKTSVAMALSTAGTVYSVDPFFRGRLGISYGEGIARLHSKRSGATNLSLIRGFSSEVACDFKHAIDFLFIDADHSYDAIKADWENWAVKVVNGGVIALHDSRLSANSPVPLGSMKFYSEDIPRFVDVRALDFVDSLTILKIERDAPSRTDDRSSFGETNTAAEVHPGFS